MSVIFKCDTCKREEYPKELNLPSGWEIFDGQCFCSRCTKQKFTDVVIDLNQELIEELIKMKMIKPVGMTSKNDVISYQLTSLGQNLLNNRLEFENGNFKKEDSVVSSKRSNSKS